MDQLDWLPRYSLYRQRLTFPELYTNCRFVEKYICPVVSLMNSSVFSALRVYALADRNVPCFVIVLLLGLVPFATNLVRQRAINS